MNDAQTKRIKELECLILKYQKSYYDGESEISDNEFDDIWDELKSIDPKNNIFNKIGADSSSVFEKRNHLMMMGSQNKANDSEEFEKWYNDHSDEDYVIEYKMDGASIELQYDSGKLIHAVTRGDGLVGDDVTNNALKMKGVIPILKEPFSGSIRGEVVMSHNIYNSKYTSKANCRNAANGIMKRKDNTGSEDLNIVCYDIFGIKEYENKFNLEIEKISYINNLGFEVPPYQYLIKGSSSRCQDIHRYRNLTKNNRKAYAFDIDGIVIKCNNVNKDDSLRDRPIYQIAYKFELESAFSKVLNIDWPQSGLTYTPVAIIEPVKLCGTIVSRASLANYAKYNELGLHYGDLVKVVKRGEIIPKIISVISKNESGEIIPYPKVCSCGKPLVIKNNTFLVCTNQNCQSNFIHKFQKFVEINEINGLGPTIIQEIIDKLSITKLSSFIMLNQSQLEDSGCGSVVAYKLAKSLETSRNNMTYEKFLASFDIPGVGIQNAKSFIASINPVDSNDFLFLIKGIRNQSIENMSAIWIAIHNISNDLYDDICESINEVNFIKDTISNKFSGMKIAISGEFNKIKRAKAAHIIARYGGKYVTSVTKNTTHLICNDTVSNSSKCKDAIKLNIPILNELQFFKFLKTAGIDYDSEK